MDIDKLLEENNYDLTRPALAPYQDTYYVCFEAIKRNAAMIKFCGDRVRDDYQIAEYIAAHAPGLIYYLSIRLQTHPDILAIVKNNLLTHHELTKEIEKSIYIARTEGERRKFLYGQML